MLNRITIPGILLLALLPITSFSATYQVGSSYTYATPHALYQANVLQHGDVIEIDAEIFSGSDALAVWNKNDLVIRGINGRPHLIAAGQYILGKGIWVLSGDNITIENIEFSGASVPDKNGAGIRLDGTGLTVRNCYFHDNENGILTSNPFAGDILIEYSEFAYNGYGDGFSHNLYVGHVNSLTFRYNYSHHADIGHNLKSRAENNYIFYNRIMDEATGNSSRLIDLSNGGFAILMGNLLMQGPNAPNNNLVGYGLEGLSNTTPHELYFINNTCVNKRTASCIFVSIQSGASLANVSNNIFAGTGTIINGTTTIMANNLIETNISNVAFADEPSYDYNLTPNSPAVDFGTAAGSAGGISLTPAQVYVHPAQNAVRTTHGNDIDAGAYEENSVPLPVRLSKFYLMENENSFSLYWTTEAELNNNGFEIQRSMDGQHFKKVGWAAGQGTSTASNEYFFEDRDIEKGQLYYYRLQQQDADGHFVYAKTLSARLEISKPEMLSIFPNPATVNFLYLQINAPQTTSAKLSVFNELGQQQLAMPVFLEKGNHTYPVEISQLPPGIYWLQISSKDWLYHSTWTK